MRRKNFLPGRQIAEFGVLKMNFWEQDRSHSRAAISEATCNFYFTFTCLDWDFGWSFQDKYPIVLHKSWWLSHKWGYHTDGSVYENTQNTFTFPNSLQSISSGWSSKLGYFMWKKGCHLGIHFLFLTVSPLNSWLKPSSRIEKWCCFKKGKRNSSTLWEVWDASSSWGQFSSLMLPLPCVFSQIQFVS